MTPWTLAELAMFRSFEIALWCDSHWDQRRARVVLGRSGLTKNAFGPL